MKWFSEKPSSVVDAWNALWHAVHERQEFYGIYGQNYSAAALLPPVPCTGEMNLKIMRNAIVDLIRRSFDFRNFGKWMEFTSAAFKDNEKFYADFGIDREVFLLSPPVLPHRCYTAGAFIRQAAVLVDRVIRYPLPVWNEIYNKIGFCLQSNLELHLFKSGEVLYGNWLDDGILKADSLQINVQDLAASQKNVGRGKSTAVHWVYLPGSKKSGRPGYLMPPLRGSCRLRSAVAVDGTGTADTFDCGIQEFEIDFASGRADRDLDFSAARSYIDDVWEMKINRSGKVSTNVLYDNIEVLLNEENFPPLPYKYLE